MYNNQYQSNQQYQAYNNSQPAQSQQYYNPQPFDTQNEKPQKFNDDAYCGDFSDSYVRADFVKKVYTLLTLELAITLGMIALGLYTGMQSWLVKGQYENALICFCGMGQPSYVNTCGCTNYEYQYVEATWVFWVSFVLAFTLQMVLVCGGNIARKAPINYVFVLLYIVFFGFMLSTLCIMIAYYCGTGIVWQAWGITFAIVFALTLYACKTKTDFSFKIGAIFILMPSILMLVIMLCIWPSFALYICLCCIFIIIYGFYLIWETQLIMGKGKLKLSIDDYVIGSLILYGTIVQLFLRIIEILAIARGRR